MMAGSGMTVVANSSCAATGFITKSSPRTVRIAATTRRSRNSAKPPRKRSVVRRVTTTGSGVGTARTSGAASAASRASRRAARSAASLRSSADGSAGTSSGVSRTAVGAVADAAPARKMESSGLRTASPEAG